MQDSLGGRHLEACHEVTSSCHLMHALEPLEIRVANFAEMPMKFS